MGLPTVFDEFGIAPAMWLDFALVHLTAGKTRRDGLPGERKSAQYHAFYIVQTRHDVAS